MEEIEDVSQLSEKQMLMLAAMAKLPRIPEGSIYILKEDATHPEFLPEFVKPGDIAVVVHGTNLYTNCPRTVAFNIYFGNDGDDLEADDPEKEARGKKDACQLGGCRMHLFLKHFRAIKPNSLLLKMHRQYDLIAKHLGLVPPEAKENEAG